MCIEVIVCYISVIFWDTVYVCNSNFEIELDGNVICICLLMLWPISAFAFPAKAGPYLSIVEG